ncbi:MAG: hypothetical protein ACK5OX_08875 [Desertimonas sp.]
MADDPSSSTRRDTLGALLDAGIDLLELEGLALGAERISLERAAAHAGIGRATAYRLWRDAPLRPQEAFQAAMLCAVVEELSAQDEAWSRVAGAVTDALGRIGPLDRMTPRERWSALVEVIRVGAAIELGDRYGRPIWRMRAGLLAAAGTRLEAPATSDVGPDDLIDALRTTAIQVLERHVPLYHQIMGHFGLRVREGYRVEHFTLLAICVIEGVSLRLPFSPREVTDVQTPYSPGDGSGWTLVGAAVVGLVREFFEPDPEASWTIDVGTSPADGAAQPERQRSTVSSASSTITVDGGPDAP